MDHFLYLTLLYIRKDSILDHGKESIRIPQYHVRHFATTREGFNVITNVIAYESPTSYMLLYNSMGLAYTI